MERLKSRLCWLKEGDTNTSYFQHHARYRKKKNYIAKLKVNDRVILDQEEKLMAICTTGIWETSDGQNNFLRL